MIVKEKYMIITERPEQCKYKYRDSSGRMCCTLAKKHTRYSDLPCIAMTDNACKEWIREEEKLHKS